jgi:hypothetical protein
VRFADGFTAEHEAGEVVEPLEPSRLGIFGCGNSFSFSFAFSLTILFIYNEGGGGGLFVAGHEQRELKDHRTVA